MGNLIYLTFEASLLLVAVSAPVLIILKSVKSYRLIKEDFEIIRFRAEIAMSVWLFLTMAMLFIYVIVAVFREQKEIAPSEAPSPTLGYIGIHLLYFAVCYLLVDWIRNRGNIKLP